jgi:two-component system response regulator RegX3
VTDAASAEAFFEDNTCSMILLDINLGGESGFELCQKIRLTMDVPIFFVSARSSEDDMLLALSIGGDDYIEKPYSLGVLLAKVKVFLKRYVKDNSGNLEKREKYDDGNLVVDYNEQKAFVKGTECKLTAMEFRLLTYLIDNKNRLITKDELFENVWNDKFTQDGTLNVHIRKLRMQIEDDPNDPKYIITVWKGGYRFNGN